MRHWVATVLELLTIDLFCIKQWELVTINLCDLVIQSLFICEGVCYM